MCCGLSPRPAAETGQPRRRATTIADNQEVKPMPRKPNYEFERRERDRLKAIKNAEKAAAKKEARERAKAETAATAPPSELDPSEKT
jgi:hypothetical protein